ncbi:sulfate ABC transporter substrate-binding protein [Selenomonas ruminantium]|nr:sulfate ABC transporter substrate-binding protein [Selenomonas ruminantium]
MKWWKAVSVALAIVTGLFTGCGDEKAVQEKEAAVDGFFMNVSYDPTRELYAEFNKTFTGEWKKASGQNIEFRQSNGGSGRQARLVIGGAEADVVTLALAYDVDEIAKAGLIEKNWRDKFPDHSAPYTSTIVFLVRRDNPKHIHDWDDLVRDDVKIVAPNPKTSGGARWNYLAAWEYAREKYNGDEGKTREFVRKLFQNVVALDSGARGATNSFVKYGQGDVLIAWENEALITMNDSSDYEIVVPSLSILAEPSVAIVDKVVDRKGTRKVAEAYINYLYSPAGQEIAARNFYRPRDKAIFAKYKQQFPELKLFTVDEKFGGWEKAQKEHFGDGGTFDQVFKK